MAISMSVGRMLLAIGGLFVMLGLLAILGERFGLRVGRLPGDFVYCGRGTTLYFPWVTSLLLSALATLLLWLFQRR